MNKKISTVLAIWIIIFSVAIAIAVVWANSKVEQISQIANPAVPTDIGD